MTTALLFPMRSIGWPAVASQPLLRSPAGTDRQSSRPVDGTSSGLVREIANPNEIVGGQGKRKHPVHPPPPPMPGLAHQAHCLEPSEDLLDPLAPALADPIPRMARRSPVDRTGPARGVLGDVGGDAEQAHGLDEIARVIALVRSERHAAPPRLVADEFQPRRPFRVARGPG